VQIARQCSNILWTSVAEVLLIVCFVAEVCLLVAYSAIALMMLCFV